MNHVWAFNAGAWQPHGHWTRVLEFRNLESITAHLRATLTKRGTIERLGIVAHGDSSGVVQLNPDLTHANYRRFAPQLRQLGDFLTPTGFIEFYACAAGSALEGRALLTGLSTILPRRTVIGFEVNGGVGDWGFTNSAGMVNNTRGSEIVPHDYLSPHHYSARWARNGLLIRESQFGRDARRHCGNPSCPGHATSLDHCAGWPTGGVDESRRRPR